MNTRRIFSYFLTIIFLSVIFVVIPLSLVYLNNYFYLPIYTNFYLKIIGILFITTSLSIITYSTMLHIKTGRETPLPIIEKPKKFIISGFYKYCRNPMYLSEIIIFLGLFFIFGSLLLLIYLIIFFIIVNILVIYIEEPELRRILGSQYVNYTKRVPRWIPKF